MKKYMALGHNSIKIEGSKKIYIDVFNLNEICNDADYIFFTHSHYDHLSINDIKKVINNETILISPESCEVELKNNFPNNKLILVKPNNKYEINELSFETTYAYNEIKEFHPKDNNWVGYLINIDDLTYYIAGDTDFVKELENITCDIAFLPIGGKYTMNYKEAADMANKINAKIIVPTHYGSIIGSVDDAFRFKENVKTKNVEIQIR